jgi:hypothetical protein
MYLTFLTRNGSTIGGFVTGETPGRFTLYRGNLREFVTVRKSDIAAVRF